ncbi:MAG: YbbR-like domain-containing protein [FCB group bacterium]|nr:YbbR-like domain-containing protein [FCB group bacterium]
MAKIFENFWLKMIALILGLLLWFHVATEKVYNYQMWLPVSKIVLAKDLALYQNPPESIMAVVSATGKQLMRKKWRRRGVKIVADQFKTGHYKLKLNTSNTFLSLPATAVTLVDVVSPTTIDLAIDRFSKKKVKVNPNIITEPDEGYTVSSISPPVPKEVTLYGPYNIIRKYSQVYTQRKELAGLRNNLSLTLPLALPVGYGLSISPDSVRLSIEVVPVKTRIFENVPVVVYNVPAQKTVTPEPSSINIELTGPPSEIDLLNKNALIASVDYHKIDSLGRASITINCPSKFKVKKYSPDSVRMIVQ